MICECARSCKFYPKLRLASGFTLTKSTRTVNLQDVPLPHVTSGRPYSPAEVTILIREYPENYQKIATSNVIFSRTADRIAAKFCMTIMKITPNDILQNCVHSCSTFIDFHWNTCILYHDILFPWSWFPEIMKYLFQGLFKDFWGTFSRSFQGLSFVLWNTNTRKNDQQWTFQIRHTETIWSWVHQRNGGGGRDLGLCF